jgi:hypothetical protein
MMEERFCLHFLPKQQCSTKASRGEGLYFFPLALTPTKGDLMARTDTHDTTAVVLSDSCTRAKLVPAVSVREIKSKSWRPALVSPWADALNMVRSRACSAGISETWSPSRTEIVSQDVDDVGLRRALLRGKGYCIYQALPRHASNGPAANRIAFISLSLRPL